MTAVRQSGQVRCRARLVVSVMLAGLLTSTASAWPAHANGSYNNASIATIALRYVGQYGGAASVDAGRSGYTSGTPLGAGNNMDGECRAFVNAVVWIASGHTQWVAGGSDYFAELAAHGTRITSPEALVKGDVVQIGASGTHTLIIVGRVSGSTFTVVDSNHNYDHKVSTYQRTVSLSDTTRAYRLGNGATAGESTTIGIARWTSGMDWKLRNSNSGGDDNIDFGYGAVYDIPVTGDWDGNGSSTVGIVRRPSSGLLWELRNSNSAGSPSLKFYYGAQTDIPVTGDWDGNGSSTVGIVRRTSSGLLWELRNSNSAGDHLAGFYYGAQTDMPVTGDWN